MSQSLPAEVLEQLSALGIEIPEDDPAAARAALTAVGKLLSAARKSLPKVPDVSFAREEETGEVLLRVKRGGRGAPLLLPQGAAKALLEQEDFLREFAETGEVPEGAVEVVRKARKTSEDGDEEE